VPRSATTPIPKLATSSAITPHDEIFTYSAFPLICFILHLVYVFRMKEGPFFLLT
jgi:hypothetical protein